MMYLLYDLFCWQNDYHYIVYVYDIPVNTRYSPNVGVMLVKRWSNLRRWPNITPTLVECLVFTGILPQMSVRLNTLAQMGGYVRLSIVSVVALQLSTSDFIHVGMIDKLLVVSIGDNTVIKIPVQMSNNHFITLGYNPRLAVTMIADYSLVGCGCPSVIPVGKQAVI